jgi:hypothetical protein
MPGVPPDMRIACLATGLLTGAVGVLMCFVDDDDHDVLLRDLAACLPSALERARAIMTYQESLQ